MYAKNFFPLIKMTSRFQSGLNEIWRKIEKATHFTGHKIITTSSDDGILKYRSYFTRVKPTFAGAPFGMHPPIPSSEHPSTTSGTNGENPFAAQFDHRPVECLRGGRDRSAAAGSGSR